MKSHDFTSGTEAQPARVQPGGRISAGNAMTRRMIVVSLGVALLISLSSFALAQDGHYAVGHAIWHRDFYAKLKRNDGGGPCCNDSDCRPTRSRRVNGHYEVKVDGQSADKINSVIAPDAGTHVCAPEQIGHHKGFAVLRHPPARSMIRRALHRGAIDHRVSGSFPMGGSRIS